MKTQKRKKGTTTRETHNDNDNNNNVNSKDRLLILYPKATRDGKLIEGGLFSEVKVEPSMI